VFCSATFGAGVVATQRPITCPKRQLQPERYMKFGLELVGSVLDYLFYVNKMKFLK
jgi:hypothetical protein